jgi:ABC-type multidrug transport system fused ATPase/permease subunit
MYNPKYGHAFKAWICIALAVLILILSVLALALPYWVWWDVDGVPFSAGGGSVATRVNAGLWILQSQDTTKGQKQCSAGQTGDSCVCADLKSRESSTARALYSIAGSDEPTCSNYNVDSCNADLSLSTLIAKYTVETKINCNAPRWAWYAKCSTRNANVPPASCPTGQWDDCMRGYLNGSIALWFIALFFLLVIIIVFFLMHTRHVLKLPQFAMIAIILAFLIMCCTVIALVLGAVAFKGPTCDNNWSRLGGTVNYHAAFGLGVCAAVLSLFLLVSAIMAYQRAVKAKNNYLYNYYGYGYGYQYAKPYYETAGYTYTAPVTYYEGAYDYTYAYPYAGYGAAPEDAAQEVTPAEPTK